MRVPALALAVLSILIVPGSMMRGPAGMAQAAAPACAPTRADALGPFYEPGAPVRSQVGRGHVLTGTVKSSRDCRPIAAAHVEFWLAGPAGEYGDAWRAAVLADAEGRYRFESHLPPPYGGRPSHIHVRVAAAGYRVLVTQYYPPAGAKEGRFDLVLEPAP